MGGYWNDKVRDFFARSGVDPHIRAVDVEDDVLVIELQPPPVHTTALRTLHAGFIMIDGLRYDHESELDLNTALFYHGSSCDRFLDIVKFGLLPASRLEQEPNSPDGVFSYSSQRLSSSSCYNQGVTVQFQSFGVILSCKCSDSLDVVPNGAIAKKKRSAYRKIGSVGYEYIHHHSNIQIRSIRVSVQGFCRLFGIEVPAMGWGDKKQQWQGKGDEEEPAWKKPKWPEQGGSADVAQQALQVALNTARQIEQLTAAMNRGASGPSNFAAPLPQLHNYPANDFEVPLPGFRMCGAGAPHEQPEMKGQWWQPGNPQQPAGPPPAFLMPCPGLSPAGMIFPGPPPKSAPAVEPAESAKPPAPPGEAPAADWWQQPPAGPLPVVKYRSPAHEKDMNVQRRIVDILIRDNLNVNLAKLRYCWKCYSFSWCGPASCCINCTCSRFGFELAVQELYITQKDYISHLKEAFEQEWLQGGSLDVSCRDAAPTRAEFETMMQVDEPSSKGNEPSSKGKGASKGPKGHCDKAKGLLHKAGGKGPNFLPMPKPLMFPGPKAPPPKAGRASAEAVPVAKPAMVKRPAAKSEPKTSMLAKAKQAAAKAKQAGKAKPPAKAGTAANAAAKASPSE